MTLSAVVAPLVVYAVIFQTLIYLSLPARLRTRIAPLVTGLAGAGISVGAGLIFGFETIGLVGGEPMSALAWGGASLVIMSVVGMVALFSDDLSSQIADPRLGALSGGDAFATIFIRIPIFTALIEEVFFRGVLHAALIALYPAETAIWLGAGLFGLWHVGPGFDQARAGAKFGRIGAAHAAVTVVATTIAGGFLVWLRIETESIWAPVAVHAATNMTMALFSRAAARRRPVAIG